MSTGIIASVSGSGSFTYTAPADCKLIVSGNPTYTVNGINFAAISGGSRQDVFYLGGGQTLYFTAMGGNIISVLEE